MAGTRSRVDRERALIPTCLSGGAYFFADL
jgi:hypothetical protein